MPLISYFPSAGGGGTIDYSSRPQIDFNGKWIKWFVEFYDGEPYWEAWFFTSGTLTVTGSYTADAWLIGGGATNNRTPKSARGGATVTNGITLSGSIAVSIGGGASGYNGVGGTTSIGNLASAPGGVTGQASVGDPYRFSDPNKQNEAGADGTQSGGAYGGWMFWSRDARTGQGYGAGGTYENGYQYYGHSGAAVIRIKI